MPEPFVYDSRCPRYKFPYGAVSCGRDVTYQCRPLASDHFTHCALIMKQEFARTERTVELRWASQEDGRDCFSATVPAPQEPDLVWYHFRFWRDDDSGCFLDKTGYHNNTQISPWQLTVYQESHTPDWFSQGVVYQIFPDRFCRLSLPSKEGLVGNRWIHENWYETPEWRPDGAGIVQNRDFYGGSLEGITAKLDWLSNMGVSILYLCPIFESASNHRYNTADYTKIDPMLGTEEDFRQLCREAKARGMRVVLDGVFNHIGSQSLYFNEDGFYPTLGAAQSQESPYYDWFSFHPWPDSYDSWWGIRTLPAVREEAPTYVDYMVEGPDSIVRRWLRAGASGWRLDVADELPDWFIEKVRAVVEETDSEALLLGEVWENASIKIAYSKRRKYLLGRELHGVMNYPFRSALLSYLKGGKAEEFREAMETLRENYPRSAFYSAMNFLGTHDTPRILTMLGADRTPENKDDRASYRLSPAERAKGSALVRLAALILFTFPGAPTVYYGDEVGMEGFEDPFNRGCYPWEGCDHALQAWFSLLGRLRRKQVVLRAGDLCWLRADGPLLAFSRETPPVSQAASDQGEPSSPVVTIANAAPTSYYLELPWEAPLAWDLLSSQSFPAVDGTLRLELPSYGALLLSHTPPESPSHYE